MRAASIGRGEERSLSLSLWAALHVAAALAATLWGPLWLMLLAPLVLGVPHVAADIRHLILRPLKPLAPGLILGLALPFGAMTLVRGMAMVGGPALPRLELSLGAAAVLVALALARGAANLRIAGLLTTLLLWSLGMGWPSMAALTIGHAHNFVAVGFWLWWMQRRDQGEHRWIAVAALAIAIAVVLSGLGEWIPPAAAGLGAEGLVNTLAPGLPAPWDWRLVRLFALMQAVHYSLWVWCIPWAAGTRAPIEERARRWFADFGALGASAILLAAIALPLAGWFAPTMARSGYLGLVLFHGWLEFAVAAHLLTSRG